MSEKRSAYKAILILGIVSLLGDIVYEGSRGLIPDYLRHLGASALVVGSIIGLGELVSYLSRPISGVIADKFRSYWPLVFLGYGLIASLPRMGMAEMIGGWFLASTLIIVERLGKGIRTPARDTIISFVSKSIGSGKAFGLHELLDQVGAVLGPMTLAAVIGIGYGYLFTFLLLLIPYIALMFSLYLAKKSLGKYVTHPDNSLERGEN
ncbi:MAG: MFS transporter, partial [Thermoprotei archaeon]